MVYSRQKDAACPLAMDPGVLLKCVHFATAETNPPVKIPWDGVKLIYAYAVYTADIGAALEVGGDTTLDIDLELDSAGGTEIMSMSFTSAAAVGTVAEATFTDESAGSCLGDANTINIEIESNTGVTPGSGANVYLYFESN